MPTRDSALDRFLTHAYPQLHMRLYDAVCQSDELRQSVPRLIDDLLEDKKEGLRRIKEKARKQSNETIAHALMILGCLSRYGNVDILRQIRDGMHRKIIAEATRSVVIQLVESNRWLREYGKQTYDFVLAVPAWSKTISLSTSEVDLYMDPIPPRLSEVMLENSHLYSFFNRVRAVRGRRIGQREGKGIDEHSVLDVDSFKPFMRTCRDAEIIGRGICLAHFTPFATEEGLRLGFFFALMGKVVSIEPVRSSTGIGMTLAQSYMTVSDSTGSIKTRINTMIFEESMENPIRQGQSKLKDPKELLSYDDGIFVIGVWILGSEYPEIVFLGLPQLGLPFDKWTLSAYLNSHRKVPYGSLSHTFGISDAESSCKEARCVLKTDDSVYYKEEAWSTEVFLSLQKHGFSKRLDQQDAISFAPGVTAFQRNAYHIMDFLSINPHLYELYCSETPTQLFEKIHAPPVREAPTEEIAAIKGEMILVPFGSKNANDIIAVSHKLLRLGYAPEDMFSSECDNGGNALYNTWMRIRSQQKKRSLDETTSALNFILSARGRVNIPLEALSPTIAE